MDINDRMAYTDKGVNHKKSRADILEILRKHNLSPKPETERFQRARVEYLRLIISQRCLRIEHNKLNAVAEQQNTLKYYKGKHPVCLKQEVRQGFWVTKDSLHVGTNPEDCRPIQGFDNWLWLIGPLPRSLIISTMLNGWITTPCGVPIPIADPGQGKLQNILQRATENCCFLQGMETLLGRQSKLTWSDCIYQPPKLEEFQDNKATNLMTSPAGKNPRLLQL